MSSIASTSTKRSPLAPKQTNVMFKPELISPKGKSGNSKDDMLSTPKRNASCSLSDAIMAEITAMNSSSPPIFSMDALTDVLGDFMQGVGSPDGENVGEANKTIEQKFSLEEISAIEEHADSMATALFQATQGLDMSAEQLQQEYDLSFLQPGTSKQFTPCRPKTSLSQLEHPLLERFMSPANSSHCSSPIYTRIYEDCRRARGKGKGGYHGGGGGSSDSNAGSGSDSDFEIDGDSSPGSEDSSESDFEADDSDSDYGGRRRRIWGSKKLSHKYGFKKFNSAPNRKQPYHHHKSSKNKEQVMLLMGDNKPMPARQISPHQLEAIAAAMGSSPVTVNWLVQNYETSEGNSLPRALMYGHYLRHCAELRLDPVNAASFGKLIRSVFVGLTTRRLGTRGNSKYHYCGIRIKDTSTLLLEDPDLSKKTRTNGKRSKKTQILAMQGVGICGLGGNKGLTLELDSVGNIDVKAVKKYLGSRCASFPEIEISEFYMPDGISYQDLLYFTNVYKKHCWDVLEAVESFQLNDVATLWHRFWQERGDSNEFDPVGLSKENIAMLTTLSEVQFAVQNLDAFTYDQMLSILMPNVIAQLPFQLLEEYQKFSLTLRSSLYSALENFDPIFIQQKLQLLDSFINELKSWVSLNLSAQAARDSMQSPNSIAQLLSDLNRINFRSVLMDVKEYVKVDEMDINVHESLKRILSGPDSIEPWSVWLVGLVEQRIGMSCAVKAAEDAQDAVNAVIKECQDLSLRWLKYMSQLKLELLLRSSGSLATFLSLELLFSNFLLHLIKVYKSRALQVPLVLYSIVRKSGSDVEHFSREERQNFSPEMSDKVKFGGPIGNDPLGESNDNPEQSCPEFPVFDLDDVKQEMMED